MLGLLAFGVFFLVALTGYGIASVLRDRQEAARALAQRLDAAAGAGASGSVLKDRRLSSIGLLDSVLTRVPLAQSFSRTIRQAGMRRRAGEVLLYVPLLACIGFLLGLILSGGPLIALLVGAAAGSIPVALIRRLKNKRTLLFAEQLPDALDLIRAALQAGHGFGMALTLVATEFPDPIATEFREVAEEMRLGLPLREALSGLMDRIDDPDLPMLVIGILIADESGGNLAEVLANIGHTVRERFKISRDVRVLTAQGRLSGNVLTALPFIVGFTMYWLNPTYFKPMTTTTVGRYMLLYVVVSVCLGHFAIRRIVSIKV
jgi:tight adherence protein B